MAALTKSTETLTGPGHFTNGVAASLGMYSVVYPLSTMQTRVMASEGTSLLRAILPLSTLYNGFGVTASGVLLAQGSAFALHDLFLRAMAGSRTPSDREKGAAGIMAGLGSAVPSTMVERISTLQQLKEGAKLSAREAFKKVMEVDGPKGLLKGFGPVTLREVKFVVGLFLGQQKVSESLEGHIDHKRVRDITASGLTGMGVGVLTSPSHRVRAIMQGDLRGSYSMLQTGRKILVEEGARGLFRGSPVRALFVGGAMILMGEGKEFFPVYLPDSLHEPTKLE